MPKDLNMKGPEAGSTTCRCRQCGVGLADLHASFSHFAHSDISSSENAHSYLRTDFLNSRGRRKRRPSPSGNMRALCCRCFVLLHCGEKHKPTAPMPFEAARLSPDSLGSVPLTLLVVSWWCRNGRRPSTLSQGRGSGTRLAPREILNPEPDPRPAIRTRARVPTRTTTTTTQRSTS